MRHMLIILALAVLLPAAPAAAQSDARCFPETGYCISGPIRAYWERNGGLPIFGYPISSVQQESIRNSDGSISWTGPIQWFERDRLEDHSAEGLSVLAGRLGAEQLQAFSFLPLLPRPGEVSGPPAPGCRYFPETRHSLCGQYLQYWERNGGLERFGYPMSEPFLMTMGPWRGEVQYFERRRMETHAELPGSPLLLGLLGREQYLKVPSQDCPVPIDPAFGERVRETYGLALNLAGCPVVAEHNVAMADQQFERGTMVWVNQRFQPRVYVVRGDPLPVIWWSFADTWSEQEPETAGLTPPPGRLEPKRGFGKVWREQVGVREALGWAIAAERGDVGVVQPYTDGATIVYMNNSNFVYLFGPAGIVWAFTRY